MAERRARLDGLGAADQQAAAALLSDLGWILVGGDDDRPVDALVLGMAIGGDAAALVAGLAAPVAAVTGFASAGTGAGCCALLLIDRDGAAALDPSPIEAMIAPLARAAGPDARVNAVLRDAALVPATSTAPWLDAARLLLTNPAMTGQTIRVPHRRLS